MDSNNAKGETVKKKRGRPTIGDKPMTMLELKHRQLAKMKAAGIKQVNVTISEFTKQQFKRYCELMEVPEYKQMSIICEGALLEFAEHIEREWERMKATKASLEAVRAARESNGE